MLASEDYREGQVRVSAHGLFRSELRQVHVLNLLISLYKHEISLPLIVLGLQIRALHVSLSDFRRILMAFSIIVLLVIRSYLQPLKV